MVRYRNVWETCWKCSKSLSVTKYSGKLPFFLYLCMHIMCLYNDVYLWFTTIIYHVEVIEGNFKMQLWSNLLFDTNIVTFLTSTSCLVNNSFQFHMINIAIWALTNMQQILSLKSSSRAVHHTANVFYLKFGVNLRLYQFDKHWIGHSRFRDTTCIK